MDSLLLVLTSNLTGQCPVIKSILVNSVLLIATCSVLEMFKYVVIILQLRMARMWRSACKSPGDSLRKKSLRNTEINPENTNPFQTQLTLLDSLPTIAKEECDSQLMVGSFAPATVTISGSGRAEKSYSSVVSMV